MRRRSGGLRCAIPPDGLLTRKQRELLEQFETEGGKYTKSNPESEGFFAKVAALFEGRG